MRPGVLQLALVGAALLAASTALAQTSAAPAPGPAVTPTPALAPGRSPAQARSAPVWRLPASTAELRVTGEINHLTWPVYIPATALSGIKSFQLAFQAAIEVMPEASNIILSINGQMVGRAPIASPNTVKTVLLDVPPGSLVSGWNAVELEISQRHRVDCSMASTYELWTQIDATRTGFVGAAPPLATIGDLPALPTDEAGATRLHLLLPKDSSPVDLGRAVRLIEQVSLRGRYAHPVIDTTPALTGLNVSVGMQAAPLPGAAKAAPPLQLSTMADGSNWLAVAGHADVDVDRAVEALADPATEAVGTEDGLRALSRRSGLRLRPGSALTLAELGIKSRAFGGRVFKESFEVLLPPDALLGDYAEADLSIDGGYTAGLTRDARLLVRVNGVIDGNLDFDRPGGAVLQAQDIHMPLEPFRPGRNRIEIEAQLPAHADETCDTLGAIGAKERFLILGTSTLSLPPLARVAQFPSISATLAGNLRVNPSRAPHIFVPRVTDGAISAVGTLLSNAAVKAGVPTGALFQRGAPQAGLDPIIVVGESSDLPAALVTAVGIDPHAFSGAWRSGLRQSSSPDGGARASSTLADAARLDAWGERVDEPGGWLGGSGSVVGSLAERFVRSLRGAGLVAYPERPLTVTDDTSFVFAQGLDGDTPLTLVGARDGATLASGAASFTDPSRLAVLDGRAVTLEDGDAGANLVPARDITYFRTQPFSFGNDRLIAAGWVSKHAAWYIGASLLSAALLGMTTWACLAFGRRVRPT